jgi:arylsulfatase
MFAEVTKGALSGKVGETPTEDFKINGQYVDTPLIDGKEGVVGIPFFNVYVEKAAIEFLDQAVKKPDTPWFINVNFMQVHHASGGSHRTEWRSIANTTPIKTWSVCGWPGRMRCPDPLNSAPCPRVVA